MRNAWAYMGDPHGPPIQEYTIRRMYIEERAEREFMSGNVPDFMRPENWPEITIQRTIGEQTVRATVRVCPDYLAIGSNEDYVRIPMSPLAAQRIADHFGFALPTMRLVDIIEDESKRLGGRLPFHQAPEIAKRMKIAWDAGQVDGRWTMSPDFTKMQNRMIEEDLDALPDQGVIRTGHKKDVIYHPGTNLGAFMVDKRTGQRVKVADRGVAIYHPRIQPANIPHEETFFDYSHGIRLIHGRVRLTITDRDGNSHDETMSMRDLLNHPEYFRLLSPTRMDIDTLYRTRHVVVPKRSPLLVQGPREHGEGRGERRRQAVS